MMRRIVILLALLASLFALGGVASAGLGGPGPTPTTMSFTRSTLR